MPDRSEQYQEGQNRQFWQDCQGSVFRGGLAERLLRAIWGCLRGFLRVCLGLVVLTAALVVGAYYVASLPHEAPSGVLADMAQMEEPR